MLLLILTFYYLAAISIGNGVRYWASRLCSLYVPIAIRSGNKVKFQSCISFSKILHIKVITTI